MEALLWLYESILGDILLATSQEWSQVLSLASEHKLQRHYLLCGLWTARLWPAKQISPKNGVEYMTDTNKK
jgi:hypothetical protein